MTSDNAPADARDRPEDRNTDDVDPAVRDRYKKIFEYSNDAIMVIDFETESFVDVNPAASELLGYSREELLAMNPEDIHPDDIDRVRNEFIADVVESGSGWTGNMTCLTSDGDEVPTEISGAVLDTPGEESSRMIAILRDVSTRVEHRQKLEATVEQLEQFAEVLSHDIRNPLNVATGRLDLARTSGDDEDFDAVADALERIEELVDQLLLLTQQEDAIGDQEVVDLADLGRAAWQTVHAPRATVSLDTELSLRADPLRLQELLENLFGNAVEHGSTGPGSQAHGDAPDDQNTPVHVTVGTLESEAAAGFYVADDGPGIPPDTRDDVSDWGYSTTANGTGLGLAIVAEIAGGHGWVTTVTESESGGARFEFSGVRVH